MYYCGTVNSIVNRKYSYGGWFSMTAYMVDQKEWTLSLHETGVMSQIIANGELNYGSFSMLPSMVLSLVALHKSLCKNSFRINRSLHFSSVTDYKEASTSNFFFFFMPVLLVVCFMLCWNGGQVQTDCIPSFRQFPCRTCGCVHLTYILFFKQTKQVDKYNVRHPKLNFLTTV